MKLKLFCLAYLMNLYLVNAQALSYLDLPVAGELWIEFKDTVGTNFTITPSGAGQTWNYSNSFIVHDTLTFFPQAIAVAPVNIANLFPQSNLFSVGQVAGDYTFVKTDFSGMYIDGLHSDNGLNIANFIVNDINYTYDLLYIPVPFQFGDVVQNTSSYDYTFTDSTVLAGALLRVTYSTFQDFETESQGQLTTPLGSYSSTIRIKEMKTKTILYEIDSFASGNYTYLTDLSFPTTASYKWFKNGPNCLIMSAELDQFNNVTTASYFTSSGLVDAKALSNISNISLVPNPVSQGSNIYINLNEVEATSMIIYDLSGREIVQVSIENGTKNLNLKTENFESGLYYLKLYHNNNVQSINKFIVTH